MPELVDDTWKKSTTGDLIMKVFRQNDYIEHA